MEVGQFMGFNTGRGYSPEGQRIVAVVVGIDPTNPRPLARVAFSDITRMISGVVMVSRFDSGSIMDEYDAGRYVDGPGVANPEFMYGEALRLGRTG